jgi:AcrR family transcriptional regulator
MTESRLLEAAYRIVAERGVRAVTTAAVGEQAGYSRGIVVHHFGSRAALMTRLAESVQASYYLPGAGSDGRERTLALVDDYLGLVEARSEDSRVFLRLWAAAVGDDEPALAQAFVERDEVFRQLFYAAIEEGRADGSVPASLDAGAAAVALVGLLRGIAMQWQFAAGRFAMDDVRHATRRLLDGGLGASPQPRNGRRIHDQGGPNGA